MRRPATAAFLFIPPTADFPPARQTPTERAAEPALRHAVLHDTTSKKGWTAAEEATLSAAMARKAAGETVDLATLFPEVRLKTTLELRSTDSQRLDLVCALPALWKGLLYDETSLTALEKALSPIDYEAAAKAQRDVPAGVLDVTYGDRTMRQWRSELLDLADAGLKRIGHLDAENDESMYLSCLRELTDTPAAELLAKAPGDAPTPEAVIEAARF